MKRYKLLNNLFGWIVFAVATATYLLTMEPTASFWDCPEFISTADKLEVGHPPGAPFFMLLGRFFTLFASDPSQVAFCANALSALASSLTILFLFWSITRLARKVVVADGGEYTLGQSIAIVGAGLVGALTYTFTDSFWFSAVEGEVYATSALFTAVVFWAILKWEEVAHEPMADRWLIFIAYLMGLSIGVHLLNLLTIPAIALVYYFKKFNVTWKGTLVALLVSFGILGVLMYGLVPGAITVASWFELLFVNSFGFSFNTGFLFYCVLLAVALVWGVYETFTNKSEMRIKISFFVAVALLGIPFIGESVVLGIVLLIALFFVFAFVKKLNVRLLNTILIALTVIAIGYSSYAVIVIRSIANPPMDQNSPDNVFDLKSYLNREQYGDRPLIYGPTYAKWDYDGRKYFYAPPREIKEGKSIWSKKEKDPANPNERDCYITSDHKPVYVYDAAFKMLFPRMYSSQGSHVSEYENWVKSEGKTISVEGRSYEVPTFAENIRFFFTYQVAYMYGRYFMWNFAGRLNDKQGYGDFDKGAVLTGIPFIDRATIGDQDNLPPDMANNKGRNVYYLMPLLLGLLGMGYQIVKGKKGAETFCITGILFFMTGLAIVLYLNQTPLQPRERDYAYAGSFYAYAIWIGFGVLGITSLLQKLLKNKAVSATIATLVCLIVPAQMAEQNWDDHDRSNRYTCRDFGYNYLISCAPNAIIFTNGDNDTFPLWYLQEVEGVRRDVRVCNLSYLQTDWYIDQMRREAYVSKPLPISWTRYEYVQGTRDEAYVYNQLPELDLKTAIQDYILNPRLLKNGVTVFPTANLYVPVNKDTVLAYNMVKPELKDSILPRVDIKLNKQRLLKHELMILEMLSQNDWKRPIYFAVTVGEEYYMGLNDHFQLEGLAYRIVPLGAAGSGEKVNTDLMFDNMIHKFRWGGIDNPKVYLDENNLRMCRTFRMMFNRLVGALIEEGKNDKALEALDYCMKVIPPATVPNDYTSLYLADQYYQLNQPEKGDVILDDLASSALKTIAWNYSVTNPGLQESVAGNIGMSLRIMRVIMDELSRNQRETLLKKYQPSFDKYMQALK